MRRTAIKNKNVNAQMQYIKNSVQAMVAIYGLTFLVSPHLLVKKMLFQIISKAKKHNSQQN